MSAARGIWRRFLQLVLQTAVSGIARAPGSALKSTSRLHSLLSELERLPGSGQAGPENVRFWAGTLTETVS